VNTVSVAFVAIPPMRRAAFKNKLIYFFRSIKCPVIIRSKKSDRDSSLDLKVLRIYGHIDIKKAIDKAAILTKDMKK